MPPLLGCVADDFTGATDLCDTLVRGGMRTVQLIGAPGPDLPAPDGADAVAVALKSRTCPPGEAVALSLGALRWLRGAGARRFAFKVCSTFDSTPRGNIGPVADALLDELGGGLALACPAFPEAGRRVFQGHLFVGDRLLSESPMRDHPLTPMTDPDLVRVLGRQTPHRVGLVPLDAARRGPAAVRARLAELEAAGCRHAVCDATEDADLLALGEAGADLPLVVGGSGIARGLPDAYRRRGLLPPARDGGAPADALPPVAGREAVLAGSCSEATRAQVARWAADRPALRLEPARLAAEPGAAGEAVRWALPLLERGAPVLVHAGAPPEEVAAAQARLGRERAGALVEAALAEVARGLVGAGGVRRLVVAGGETSGAVVQALGVRGLRIGPRIDPGIPACAAIGAAWPLALALKSGNFGAPDFFERALRAMP